MHTSFLTFSYTQNYNSPHFWLNHISRLTDFVLCVGVVGPIYSLCCVCVQNNQRHSKHVIQALVMWKKTDEGNTRLLRGS